MKVEENWVELQLNGTHQLLAYAEDGILLRDNIDVRKRNKEPLFEASREAGLEIKVEKIICISCWLIIRKQDKTAT
jgi:hypothetical protein